MNRRMLNGGMALLTAVLMATASAGMVAAEEVIGTPYEYALTGANAASSTLSGSEAGSFSYFRIAYPGNDTDLRIRVTVAPYAVEMASAVGFNVYGPGGRVDTGVYQSDDGYLEVTYQEDEAADLLVQIYNYGSSTISYTIRADGLPQVADVTMVSTEELVATEPSATETAEDSSNIWEGVSGGVVGHGGGAFGEHAIEYSGDEEEITVTVRQCQADPS